MENARKSSAGGWSFHQLGDPEDAHRATLNDQGELGTLSFFDCPFMTDKHVEQKTRGV
jgi:hypothetical protein